jgi:hypothetical protein
MCLHSCRQGGRTAIAMKRLLSRTCWLLVACAAGSLAGAQEAPLTEDSCAFITRHAEEEPVIREIPGLQILNRRPDEPLVVKGMDVTVNGVVCWRSEAKFAENDYLVSDAGLPLFIKTDFEDEAQNRTIVLERIKQSYRVRLLSGPELSAGEKQELVRLIAVYQKRLQATPASAQKDKAAQSSSSFPADQPHLMTSEQLSASEEAIAPLIAQARETYPEARRRYLNGLPSGHHFFITTRLHDAEGRFEQVFVRVQSIHEGMVTGEIANPVQLLTDYKEGQALSFSEDEVRDWTIVRPDGSEEGNAIGKFLEIIRRNQALAP